jgi:hypothetical protein
MSQPELTQRELDDIKTQFYAIMEDYPKIYANFKMTPDLPSAREARDKTDAALSSLHSRMFAFKAAMEQKQDENEETMAQLAQKGARLNAMLARKTAILNNKDQTMATTPLTVASNTKVTVMEPFISMSGLQSTQLQGCNPNDNSKCPCVNPGESVCASKCNQEGEKDPSKKCPPSDATRSLVVEAANIEKRAYIHAACRIIYLIIAICIVVYFIFQTVGSADSTILYDARMKADQLKTGLTNNTYDVINNVKMRMNANPNANANPNMYK